MDKIREQKLANFSTFNNVVIAKDDEIKVKSST